MAAGRGGVEEASDGRTPLFNEDAERYVLGALLIDNGAFDDVADVITEPDFYIGDHRKIYRGIVDLLQRGKAADALTVSDWLTAHEFEVENALAYLSELFSSTPGASGAASYAKIVRERSLRRALVIQAQTIIDMAYTTRGREIGTIIDEAQGRILAIAESNGGAAREFVPVKFYIGESMQRIQELAERDSDTELIGLATGFHELDRKTAGMNGGDLIVVGGRPSMGKTSFAMNIVEHVGLKAGVAVGVFTMEMPGVQLGTRMMASDAGLNQHRVRRGRLNESEFERLYGAVDRLSTAPIYFDESVNLTPNELRARARRLFRATKGKLGLLVLDYLQLMGGNDERENRTQQVAGISRALKLLAKELNIPVIALSQLSRELEKRTNRRPIMSDLRESGAIEQDADVVLFLYRDEVYNEESSAKGVAEVIVAKQRNGPIGTVRLAFRNENTRFDNLLAVD
jgi:replicative DNA helicase